MESAVDLRVSTLFPADERLTAEVRRMLRAQLSNWRVSYVADDVLLAAHELFANAVRYGSDPTDGVVVSVEHRGSDLRVGVTDSSPNPPQARDASLLDVGGRGLQLVDALSSVWGFDVAPDGAGKTVWFCVELTSGASRPSLKDGCGADVMSGIRRSSSLVTASAHLAAAPMVVRARSFVRSTCRAVLRHPGASILMLLVSAPTVYALWYLYPLLL